MTATTARPAIAPPAVELRGVEVRLGGRVVLDGIDLAVPRGAFVGVVGESGCGKTTLLRLVAGLQRADEGTVAADGRPVAAPRAGVGFVFQQPTLLTWRTALENVLLPAQLEGRRITPELRARAQRLMARAGLSDAGGKLPRELSGGMQSRVALARALLLEPNLLLLDEPFAALDAITRERLGLALLDLWSGTGLTALFVTHDIGEAVFLADEVILMGARPGRFHRRFAVPLPRPRDLAMRFVPGYIALCREIRLAMEDLAVGEDRGWEEGP